jgi:hypothetical protein
MATDHIVAEADGGKLGLREQQGTKTERPLASPSSFKESLNRAIL